MKKVIVLLFLLGTVQTGRAENAAKLIRYFEQNDYAALKTELSQHPLKKGSDEARFFKAVFEPIAEKAFVVYQDIFKKGNGYARYLSAQRLKDYYYSRGYYATAADYQKFLLDHQGLLDDQNTQPIDKTSPEQGDTLNQEKLYIQVGAFGMRDNATQMRDMLKTQKIESRIVLRTINKQKFYCVWIPGKDGFKPTLNFANELMEKYHLKYRLIKE